jgi:predicted nucleic acid-binding protein
VRFLLDTCVISELIRPTPTPSVIEWMDDASEEALYLSVLTLGELEKGIARLRDARRRAKLTSWVRRELSLRFEGRVLAVDLPVAERWGTLVGESEAKGRPLPVIDSLLAATSLQHDLIVVTRNTADFERCGARCFDPWAS